MLSDGELLRAYAEVGSEAAFTELVKRHINVVYRTALRRVGGNAHAADDVTQRVFSALARKASNLKSHGSLAGWLYTSTRFAAAEVVRGEQRRRKHEEEASTMNELNASAPLATEQLEPFLDEIMEQLSERDREAVILHFFEGKSFVEIAEIFASTADATRMRINRALERIHRELSRRGIASTGAALAAALANQAVVAAGAPSAAAVAAAVFADVGAATLGLSAVARVAQVFMRPRVLITGGVIAGLVALGIAVGEQPAKRATDAAAALAVAPGNVDRELPVRAAAPESRAVVSEPMTEPGQPVAPGRRALVATPRYADLSPAERSILAILWGGESALPSGRVFLLGIAPFAPNQPGVEPLLARGFVIEMKAVRADYRRIQLSDEGRAYCAAHRDEVENYQPTGKIAVNPSR